MNLEKNTKVKLSLSDISGKVHIQKEFDLQSGSQKIELSSLNLESGIYELTINAGNKIANKKVITF